jgi:hypothetical protein
MQNFSINVNNKQFDIVLPLHFGEVVERVAAAFDFAEEDSEDGVIPPNRQGVMVNEPIAVVSEVPEAEMYVEDELKRKLSQRFTKEIGRKCRVTGVFGPDRSRNGKFETAFEITFVVLA